MYEENLCQSLATKFDLPVEKVAPLVERYLPPVGASLKQQSAASFIAAKEALRREERRDEARLEGESGTIEASYVLLFWEIERITKLEVNILKLQKDVIGKPGVFQAALQAVRSVWAH